MFTRLWALVRKELISLWKDKRVRSVLIIPPILQTLVFSYAANFDVKQIPLVVWNEDATLPARDLIYQFTSSGQFKLVGLVNNIQGAEDYILEQTAMMVLHIPQNFSGNLLNGKPIALQLIIDGRRSNAAMVIQGYAQEIIQKFQKNWRKTTRLANVASIETRIWYNSNLDSQWFVLPGLVGLLTAITTLLITALSVARERELGTFEQLLVTPLRTNEIMLGKIIPALMVGFLVANVVMIISQIWFHIPFAGNILKLYLAIFLFLLAIVGIGLSISTISKTQQQAILGVFLFLAPAVVLSGMMTPIDNMPLWCQFITYLNPLRYIMIVSRGVFLQDIPWGIVLTQIVPLAVIAALTIPFSASLFRKRLG